MYPKAMLAYFGQWVTMAWCNSIFPPRTYCTYDNPLVAEQEARQLIVVHGIVDQISKSMTSTYLFIYVCIIMLVWRSRPVPSASARRGSGDI